MDKKEINTIDFKSLSANGLLLPEESFKLILDQLTKGANEAKNFLNAQNEDWPKFNFSKDTHTLGYSVNDDAICVSINHLNQALARSTQLEFKDQLLMFIPDLFYIIVKYIYWLKLIGREATIHRYQKIGNPELHIPFPKSLPITFSPKLLLFSNLEVEARTMLDAVNQHNGENAIWKNVDVYLSQKYPQYYNKSIDELNGMQKPDFPMSFEMEFYRF